jgi:hypothetical protein
MASEYIQARIDYRFANIGLLYLAFKAAYRSEEEGTSNDGNRGLAKIRLCAVDMRETYRAIVVQSGTLSMFYCPYLCLQVSRPDRGRTYL